MSRLIAIFALSALTLLNTQAASALEFDCQTDRVIEGQTQTRAVFSIENLDNAKTITYSGDGDMPVKMTPAESVLMLNENWGVKKSAKGIVLSSDGDGCQFTTMVLFEDAGFRKGYVSVKGKAYGCGAEDYYSTVSCKVK